MVLAAEKYLFMLEDQISSAHGEEELGVDKWLCSMAT